MFLSFQVLFSQDDCQYTSLVMYIYVMVLPVTSFIALLCDTLEHKPHAKKKFLNDYEKYKWYI